MKIWKKRRAIKFFGLICLIIFIGGLTLVIREVKADRSYIIADHEVSKGIQNGFNIGIVGDSWTADGYLENAMSSFLLNNDIENKIATHSLPGKKSGQIYQDLLSNPSSGDMLENETIDSILVVSGVNDAAGHIGSDYYVQNTKNIISLINSKGKMAYVLELPEFGIEEPEPFLPALKHSVYKIIFDKGKTNIIKNYRNELEQELSETDLNYVIIPYSTFIDDYETNLDLYQNPSHLNEEGLTKLGEHIAEFISQDTKS